jgi:hypothetical protein
MKNKAKGASLLELLLVMIIAVIIILMSMRYYYVYERIKKINLLRTSIAYLMNSLNDYYFIACKNNNMVINKDIKVELIKAGLLQNPLYNPWGGVENLTAMIVQDNNHFYQLKVVANIISENNQTNSDAIISAYIRSVLNGDPLIGNDPQNGVVWTRFPSYSRDSLNSLEWIFEPKPVSLTSINNGLDSNLWILNRQLAWFTKQNEQNEKSPCNNE